MQQTWDESLEIGGKKMDDEHRLQVNLINELERMVLRGDDPALEKRTIAQLSDFTRAHFESEELLMHIHRYAQLEEHKHAHGEFMDRLQEIREKVADRATSQAVEAIGSWRSSLIDHIRGMDLDFAQLESAIKYVKSL